MSYERNIYILDPNNFAQFIEYQGSTYDQFMEIVEVAKNAISDENDREILNEKAVESIATLKDNENYLNNSTKEFKELC